MTSIVFTPFLPWPALGLLAALALLALGYALWRRAPGVWWRGLVLAAGLAALANPAVVNENRLPLDDVAVVVVDDSPSQTVGDRATQTQAALVEVTTRLARRRQLETRVVRASEVPAGGALDAGTRLFAARDQVLVDIPANRLAGTILITDGQVHDAPEGAEAAGRGAPVHALLTGTPGERDRRLVVERAPKYGLVGSQVSIFVRVEDLSAPDDKNPAVVTVRQDRGQERRLRVPIGVTQEIPLTLEHGGPTVIEITAEPGPEELTTRNNRVVVAVNGVRDRLRVLLVSGEPYPGERTWRNLLKADPSVDLVHFTILRPPEKQDGTPVNELSLIAFPTRELFEVKLQEFDLIIFDRYRRRGVLPRIYLENVAAYVTNGGAVLEAAGPAFATPLSLFRTALAEVLPAHPTGRVVEQPFRPALTSDGRRHPVTADLPGAGESEPSWGRWFRMIDTEVQRGAVLMDGAGGRPVLVLDRVGQGRVAQLLSDHGWLWARGYEGGGPQAELLRRIAHWLMKEPELEENDLRLTGRGDRLEIARRSLKPDSRPVQLTTPSDEVHELALEDDGRGRAVAAFQATESGLYQVDDGERRAVAAVGAINPREFADVRASEAPLGAVVADSGGAMRWLVSEGVPDVRLVGPGRATEGRGWIGLKRNDQYLVTGVDRIALLPPLLLLALLAGGLMFAWRRDGA